MRRRRRRLTLRQRLQRINPVPARQTKSAPRSADRNGGSNEKILLIAICALACIAVAVAIALIARGGGADREAPAAPTAVPALAPVDTPEPTATPEPTPAPTATPEPDLSALRPTAPPGWLPVFTKAKTTEKVVAITVDDCYQAENLQKIVDCALEHGGKLTIFPIGQNVLRERHSEVLRYAYQNGFELENHTFTHNGLYGCTHEELAKEVYLQNLALSYILGVDYQAHFLRPKGGDARLDQRIHAYAKQMGYYGIAHWSASGSASPSRMAADLQPGAIYLFHTTDKDLEKLLAFIPYCVEQGYKLVTLNELFGYPENETKPFETTPDVNNIPPLEPYEIVLVPMQEGTYWYNVQLLQQALIQQGYLRGNADGIFGESTEEAVKRWQRDHGMDANGIADIEMQKILFGM